MIMHSVKDIRKFFISELSDEAFTIDKSGQKTIEMFGASFIADEPSIFGSINEDYVLAELEWYQSQSTNINDINYGDSPPAAWTYSANKHGEINSNYGKLIFDDIYYNQYGNVLDELLANPGSRRATMIYNRPSIWQEYNENDKNDFICTNAVTYYIRNGQINAVVQMRSNDVVYGYKNDFAWQHHVLTTVVDDYNSLYHQTAWDSDYRKDMEVGHIIWQVQNLHVYERHFNLVK